MRIGRLNDIANIIYTVRRAEGDAKIYPHIDGNPFSGERLFIKREDLYEDILDLEVDLGEEYYVGDLCLGLGDDGAIRKVTVYDEDKTRILASYSAETGKNIAEKSVTLEIHEKLRGFIIEFNVYFSSLDIDGIDLWGSDTDEMLLFPTPVSVKKTGGYLPLSALTSISVRSENARAAFDIFAEKLLEKTGFEAAVSLNGTLRFIYDESLLNNGYRLKITEKAAELYAKDDRGFIYGAENLIKLVSTKGVPAIEVDDAPRVPFRAVHIMMPREEELEFAKRLIKYVVSPMGYNTSVIERAGDCEAEKETVEDLVDYARSFGIEPILEFSDATKDHNTNDTDELTADIPQNKNHAHYILPSNEKDLGGKIYEFMLSAEMLWSDKYSQHLRYIYDRKLRAIIPCLRHALRGEEPLTGHETLIYDVPADFPLTKDTEFAKTVSVEKECRALIFRHVATKKLTNAPSDEIGHYKITYSDGRIEIIPVEYGINISHFERLRNESFRDEYCRDNGYSATYFVDGLDGKTDDGTPVTVYRYEWRNPHPEKAIDSVTVVNGKFKTEILLLRLCSI